MLILATWELGVWSRFLQVCLTSVGTCQFVFRAFSSRACLTSVGTGQFVCRALSSRACLTSVGTGQFVCRALSSRACFYGFLGPNGLALLLL